MNRSKSCINGGLALLAAVGLYTSNPQAAEFKMGAGWRLDLDTTMTYSAQWRVVDPDEHKIEFRPGDDIVAFNNKINTNDGSLNFDKGAFVQNQATALVDIKLSYEDYGIFARGKAFYDDVYNGDTDHSERDFLTYNSAAIYGGDAGFREFPEETVDTQESHIEWLDYFAYATWSLPGDRLLDLRLGRQVINWGEATFYQGINGLQKPH
ncbi:MAG: DUF1302 family protein [Halioglobus sp.]|nr:DUF1302 family protein [Halioglobus sp.]